MLKKITVGVCLSIGITVYSDEVLTYSGNPLVEKPEMAVTNIQATSKVPDHFRICSYNVENFEDGIDDGAQFTPKIADQHARMIAGELDKINPDVVVLEEVENAKILSKLNRYLKSPFPLGYVAHFGTGGTEQKLNVAVLSRYPLESVREIDFGPLTGPGRPTRGFLNFTLNLSDHHDLLVYGIHLKSNFGEGERNIAQRKNALALLVQDEEKMLKEKPDVTWEVLILGDTNVDPEQPQFTKDTSFGPIKDWIDLWLGRPEKERITLPTRYGDPKLEFPPATFDRFFVSKDLTEAPWKVEQPEVLQEGADTENVNTLPGYGNHISDHYPVYLDISK